MSNRTSVCVLAALALSAGVSSASAQELFRDQMIDRSAWGINNTSDTVATFNYDYSADGIPEAPSSLGSDVATAGLKLEANTSASAGHYMSLYPLGESYTGNYRLRFDAWTNYDVNERINGGSAGTTEFIGGGVGYDNTSTDVGVGAQLIFTNDGGSGSDWRAFEDGTFIDGADMTAGSRNGFDAHYSDFLPGVTPPAGQSQDAFVDGVAGSPGFQWITVDMEVYYDTVVVNIEKPGGDTLSIVNIDASSYSTDGNVMVFYADFFSSVTARPDLTFGLIDNVVVSVPEPASMAMFGLAGLVALRRR